MSDSSNTTTTTTNAYWQVSFTQGNSKVASSCTAIYQGTAAAALKGGKTPTWTAAAGTSGAVTAETMGSIEVPIPVQDASGKFAGMGTVTVPMTNGQAKTLGSALIGCGYTNAEFGKYIAVYTNGFVANGFVTADALNSVAKNNAADFANAFTYYINLVAQESGGTLSVSPDGAGNSNWFGYVVVGAIALLGTAACVALGGAPIVAMGIGGSLGLFGGAVFIDGGAQGDEGSFSFDDDDSDLGEGDDFTLDFGDGGNYTVDNDWNEFFGEDDD